MNNTSAHEGKGDFLILKNWFPSTTANKVHVWTLCGSPRIKSSSYQLLNAVIFNVLVRHFCQGILGVENPSLKPKWGGWQQGAVHSSQGDTGWLFFREELQLEQSWKLNPDPQLWGAEVGKSCFLEGFVGLQCWWQLQWRELWIMKWGKLVDFETKIITLVLSPDSGAAFIHSQLTVGWHLPFSPWVAQFKFGRTPRTALI